MRKRRFFFFCLGTVLVLTAVVWAIFREREPTYDGRTLSEWADLSTQGNNEATNAIRHMGTNTFPVILNWLHSEPGPLKLKLLRGLNVVPDRFKPEFLISRFAFIPAQALAGRARAVLGILQEESAPIAPEICRLSYDKSSFIELINLHALRSMGATGLPHLIRAMRDRHHPHRTWAIVEIGRSLRANPAFTNAIEALIECTADNDPSVRREASTALAYWASELPSGAFVDDFKKSLGSTNDMFQQEIKRFEMVRTSGITNSSPR